MKHKYIKNFKHLINLINSVINELTDEQITEINEQGGIGDAQFYYDYVYQYEYCDAFAYDITKVSRLSLAKKLVILNCQIYKINGVVYGRNYNKIWLSIPDELKDK